MLPPVDIIMPAYNASATIEACVKSILAQSLTDFRLIVVNDASDDHTLETIKQTAKHDQRVEIIDTHGRGIVDALNTGITYSTAPLIARMDADDVMHPDRIGKQLAYLERNPAIGVVGCLVETTGFQGGFEHYLKWSNVLVTPGQIADARFIESPVVHPTVMFRRELIDQHGGYRNGDFPEDYELWLRWMEAGVRFAKVDEVLMRWHDRPERLTRQDPRYSVDSFYRIKLDYLARWLKRINPHYPDVWIWGAGPTTRKRMRALTAHGTRIAGWIDIDPDKIGQSTPDGPVHAPDDLPEPDECFVLTAVASRGAREKIAADLRSRGFAEGENFTCVA